jgi:transglutaminase-like putative cysteine protease
MYLRVFHRTRYVYRAPVSDSYNEVRLRPATEDKSRLEFFLLNIHPPVRLRHFRDSHRNYVHYFELAEPHTQLTIESQSLLRTTSQYDSGVPSGIAFDSYNLEENEMLVPFLGASKFVTVDFDIWKLAIDIQAGRTCVFATAEAIMRYIFEHWTYAPNTTTASTHMLEVLQTKRGVCQDFTHVMLGLCRALKIPARYVSGYLYNAPEGELRGAQASHAWCEVFIPGHGWCGMDPTNNALADERHVKIATGRDYEDAAPVSGHFDGPPGASAGLDVKLTIQRLD